MTQLRDRRRIRQERIALISRLARQHRSDGFQSELYGSVQRHADEQGFGIDEFYLGEKPLPDARLSQILVSRGIHGVLFFPGKDRLDLEYPELDWRHFATVLIGFNTTRENLHQVASDYTYDIDHVLKRSTSVGLRRIGLAMTAMASKATNHAWASRFLLHQHGVRQTDRVPLLLVEGDRIQPDKLLSWFRRYRPEVILIEGNGVLKTLLSHGVHVPEDVRLINLAQRGEDGLAGIDPDTAEVGRAAVELLASLLRTNQFGQPDFPRTIEVKGHWSPGASFLE